MCVVLWKSNKMALSTNKVPPLSTIAFYSVIRQCWRCSGVAPLFVRHACETTLCGARPGELKSHCQPMTLYFKTIDRTIKKLLAWDYLPRNLIIKLANCFIDFDKNMREFIFSLSRALTDFRIEILQRCIDYIIVTGDGRIDKSKSLVNIALSGDVVFERSYTSYFCVGHKAIMRELQKRYKDTDSMLTRCPELGYISVLSFCNPDSYWASRCHYTEMDDKFYQCVCVYGTKESMEYFLQKIDPLDKQGELAKAAVYAVAMSSLNLEKILFFYKNMEKSVWVEFLKRNFYAVFPEFMNSKRYRHMCVVFFKQVQEHLDYRVHFWIIEYMADQFTLEYRTSSHKKLLLGDVEPLLKTIWYETPMKYKQEFGNKIFKILNRLILQENFNIISIIIEDPVYNKRRKAEMIASILMYLIVHKKTAPVANLLKKLKPETLGDGTTISDWISYDNIKAYIMLSDHCKNVSEYTRILEYRFTSVSDMKTLKRKLLMDTDFMSGVVDMMKQPQTISIQNFQMLLAWCFDNSDKHAYYYMLNVLLPFEYMTSIFRNYLIGTRKTFYSITGFTLTESQVQIIRRKIASDTDLLYVHWATLISEEDYESIKCFLNTVFNDQAERENFLVNFFNSEIGVNTLYNLIMEETFDEEFHCNFEFRRKLKAFLRFRKNIVITEQLSMVLNGLLQHYGHPNAAGFQLKIHSNSSLFPYESLDDMRVVNDANYRIFRCLMSCDLMVDFISDMLMMIKMPVTHITELSVMYELHAGIRVPVVL